MEQDRTDGSSVGVPPVSRKRKTSEFRSEAILGRAKPSEFHSKPFLGGPSEFCYKPFLDEKNSEFRSDFGRVKTSEFCPESFSEENKLPNSVPNHFRKRKNWGKRLLLLAASLLFIISQNFVPIHFVPSYGMDSYEMLGIKWNRHFIPRNSENRSESIPRNFFGTKFLWQP
jgi:hypothetical protein